MIMAMLSFVLTVVLRAAISESIAVHATNLDPITDFYRPLKQNDHATNQVVRYVLQAKSYAHTHCAGEDSESSKVDSGYFGQNDKKANNDHDVLSERCNCVLYSKIERGLVQNAGEQDSLYRVAD